MLSFLLHLFFGSVPQGQIIFPQATVQVEVARTEIQRRQGLMNRIYLPQNQGMIFVFADEQVRNFWMKNTLLPLDMIFLDHNQQIVDIKENVPPCRRDPCLDYPSKKPAQFVLEMNAGSAKRLGLQENGLARIILSQP